MKTQGVTLVAGSIVCAYPETIPSAFWARLKHAIDRAGLRAEFLADERASRNASAERPWPAAEALFMRWVTKLGLEAPRWPWERGWSESDVDEYLQAIPKARAA